MFHVCSLFAASVFVVNLYMFRLKWPSSAEQFVVLKDTAVLLFFVIALGYFYVGIAPLPCTCSGFMVLALGHHNYFNNCYGRLKSNKNV
jgi:hypothetical protein